MSVTWMAAVLLACAGDGGKGTAGDDDDTTPTGDDDDTTPTGDDDDVTSDTGDPVEEVRVAIPAAAGGTVEAFGATLVIAAGALAADTEIVVRRAAGAVPDPDTLAGDPLDFGPDGTAFAIPATLTLPVTEAAGAGEVPVVSWLDGGRWTDLPSAAGAGEVSAEISHFTVYGPRYVPGPVGGNQVLVDGVPVEFPEAIVSIPGNNSVTYTANTPDFQRRLILYTTEGVWLHTCDGVTTLDYADGPDQFQSRNPGGSCEVEILDHGGFGYPFRATYRATLTDATGARAVELTLGSMEVARP